MKDRLREATAEAYDLGVRGVPSVAVGDDVSWATTAWRRPRRELPVRAY